MTNPYPTSVDPASLDYGKTPEQIQATREAEAAGVPTTRTIRRDYWSTTNELKHYLKGQEDIPESDRQYVVFKPMNEGARARFQKLTNKGVVVDRMTNDIRMGMDPAGDRHSLLEVSITDWLLFRGDEQVPFRSHELTKFINQADPDIVDDIERAIRKANPWMESEISSDEIKEQIDELEKRYIEAKKREEEKADF